MRKDGNLSPATKLCAVIGNPVAHSLSPSLHNAAFNELGLDFVYVAFRVENLKAAIDGMRALENFRGLSVTIPHKIEILDYLDEVSDLDRAIGSVNTVINEGGRLVGLGTDGQGALKALMDAGALVDGATLLMLGAGGAARAIAFTLANNCAPAALIILDVNEPMLIDLTADLVMGTGVPIEHALLNRESLAEAVGRANIIINCTPIGMHPHEDATLVPAELFRPEQVIFDIVYTPLETRLLAEARARGCRVISGVEMFINQAILQFERFTGEKAPEKIMRNVVMERLKL